jgi:hypothetical protein
MSSILVLLAVDGSKIQYILACENPKDQYICLIRFLTDAKISLCSQEDYMNPNTLQPQQIYCVVKDGNLENAYTLFQCLPTPDWESKEEKAPNFTSVVGSLAWVMMAKDDKPIKDDKPDDMSEEKKTEISLNVE